MACYKRCEAAAKVNGRHVYEGAAAGGGCKLYCWFASGSWWFNNKKANIGSVKGTIRVTDQAASPERIASTSTWKWWDGTKYSDLCGVQARALSEEE